MYILNGGKVHELSYYYEIKEGVPGIKKLHEKNTLKKYQKNYCIRKTP